MAGKGESVGGWRCRFVLSPVTATGLAGVTWDTLVAAGRRAALRVAEAEPVD